ncbi:hypothetical protein GCM10011492_19820 [Flexivirga endophytica]|uniref:Uncharacterized protein n=1 Tax=Flexivirga endophytica TaxID=1849103 RepID=A0A916T4R5_9MICO|nr:hypothetical protein [Flexivirga endophytica]GGB29475.1 hypothetical protein GCM10011492_19820 [Flexivirga endophytica]GHB50556.1 hypothetical protein GCM10008112_19090 [Flexivirga endophytica]
MKTTQSLNASRHQHHDHDRAPLGFSGRVRALWRNQEDAQQLLLEKQAPWLRRR